MEYRNELTYTGQQVQEILDNALLKKAQELTEAERLLVKDNLGIEETDLSSYATREEMNKAIGDAVDAIPTPDVSGQIGVHNASKDAHPFIQESVENMRNAIPNKVSQLENDKGYLTQHQDLSAYATRKEMNKAIEQAVSSIPTPDVSGQIEEHNEDKSAHPYLLEEVGKVEGKIPTKASQLENDRGYLTAHQDISHLATKADLNGKQDWIEDLEDIRQGANREIPTKVSQLENDEGFLKEHQDVSNLATKEEVITIEANALQAKNDASIAKTEAIKASTNASEALRQAQVSTDAIATLKGLENSDEAMAIIAAEITKIAQNSSDIKGLKEMIVTMTEEEYEAMEDIDQAKIYMLY